MRMFPLAGGVAKPLVRRLFRNILECSLGVGEHSKTPGQRPFLECSRFFSHTPKGCGRGVWLGARSDGVRGEGLILGGGGGDESGDLTMG